MAERLSSTIPEIPPPPGSGAHEMRAARERYESEIAYFDREAEENARSLAPLDPLVVERFKRHTRARFCKEFRLGLVAPIEGKRVLDVGCGDGEVTVLLASLGAKVTGIDISPRSIELARTRAEVAGLGDRVDFVCAPLTAAEIPAGTFDVVWGDGVLHHVIPELDGVMEAVVRWTKPGGMVIFAEPLSLSPTLRKIRLRLPIPVEGTPDERPLEPAELDIIKRHLPEMHLKPFRLLGRLDDYIVDTYERAPVARRALVNALHVVDEAVLAIPGTMWMAGQVVIYAKV